MTTIMIMSIKNILVCLVFLCLLQVPRSLAEFDAEEHGHVATYFRDASESNPALMKGLSREVQVNLNAIITTWESLEYTILSRALHEMEANQFLELYFVRFGEDDFNFLLIQFERRAVGRQVSSIQIVHLLDHHAQLMAPYHPLLPNVEADEEFVRSLLRAMGDAVAVKSLEPLRKHGEMLLAMDPAPPLVATYRMKHHTDDVEYIQLLGPQGEPRMLTCRALTEDIYMLAVFQPASIAPSVWVFTVLHNRGNWHVIGINIVAGGHVILPYLSRIE